MAIYHLTAKPISRALGRSATGAAAYRAGVEIVDQRTGMVHDYTRKNVLHAELILPGGQAAERAEFWNRVELHHKREDAVVARELEISLPRELDQEQRQEIEKMGHWAIEFAQFSLKLFKKSLKFISNFRDAVKASIQKSSSLVTGH